MTIHYTFGGSTAARTLACPAWITEAKKAPAIDRTSEAAERGTLLHELLLERVFLDGKPVVEAGSALEDDDYEQLVLAEEVIRKLFAEHGVTEFVCETTMAIADDVGGSVDMIAAGPDTVLIIDAKFGRQPVSAVRNKQLLFYAMLAQESSDVSDLLFNRRIIGAIVQPALPEPVATYAFAEGELEAFKADMLAAIETARAGASKPVAGEHCAFCKAAPYCDAKREAAVSALAVDPKASESLAQALQITSSLQAWVDAVKAEAERVMLAGGAIEGYKVVHKRSIRKWNETAHAVLVATGLRVVELISPAQAEKVLKKAGMKMDLQPLLDSTEPGLTIAPEDDKRERVVVKPLEQLM